ncbi:MAG: M3 family metallopeptidase [Bacteroidaceae bacterium]|nr:M3 family metallopeptidase [Bacteroidaceae bacterium]
MEKIEKNPFEKEWNSLHQTIPFSSIHTKDYEPAIVKGITLQKKEIDAITKNPAAPTFENTIVAYEKSGRLLDKASSVFFTLMGAETNDEMQELAQKLMPLLTEHATNIGLNKLLFERIKTLYHKRQELSLTQEESKLLENSYDSFARNGALLEEAKQTRYREIKQKLSQLSLDFSEKNLKETNRYELLLKLKKEVKGLPDDSIEKAAAKAKERGKVGFLFTLDAPSFLPVMTYAQNRELRKALYLAYTSQCAHQDEWSTLAIVKEMVSLRCELAQLLGYNTYADYVLTHRMAKKAEKVYQLLEDLIKAYQPTAQKEVKEVEKWAKQQEGDDFQLRAWDWAYYSNQLKDATFHINSEMLRPYFELEQVKKGVFGLATKLYGIRFEKTKAIEVYHPDVEVFEVIDEKNNYLGVLYTDFHPRAGKNSGAWMTEFKGQWKEDGRDSRPHILLVMNFTTPTPSKPALLTFGEVTTFLHEFGHALHGLLSDVTYESLSGTNVYRDFVELPSQFMENYAVEKEFLSTFAFHYQTHEVISDELIQRIIDSSNFNVGYACLRQISFGWMDMAWHNRETAFDGDVIAYEKEIQKKTQLLPDTPESCMSSHFSHLFAGGYAAGYYGYKWAEVLDADAFSLFKEKGIFNAEVANAFRKEVLSKGGTEDPMVLYKRFRGQEPTINALLKRNGILND